MRNGFTLVATQLIIPPELKLYLIVKCLKCLRMKLAGSRLLNLLACVALFWHHIGMHRGWPWEDFSHRSVAAASAHHRGLRFRRLVWILQTLHWQLRYFGEPLERVYAEGKRFMCCAQRQRVFEELKRRPTQATTFDTLRNKRKIYLNIDILGHRCQ